MLSNRTFKHTSYEMYLGAPFINFLDFGKYITRVEYNESMDTNQVYALGSRFPIDREDGAIFSTASITFLQEGLDKLDGFLNLIPGIRNYMDLPTFNITIVQERFDGTLKVSTLNGCKFTNFGMSVMKGNLIIEQTINLSLNSISY